MGCGVVMQMRASAGLVDDPIISDEPSITQDRFIIMLPIPKCCNTAILSGTYKTLVEEALLASNTGSPSAS
jgi:hypothetical protein